ncbi:FAD-dependent monooxygenase [Solirubrobacter ginsenosidimutans]|uniref:FAD-dependent monooxygenase n=1 Tax=Solirubrobacter ginsenosidimutans TaxID=490573 RepID=A0A9X3MNF6_9ACTN|nr:FAD-dependent monooxygenase [Solirubrobacter ginsenosidimutans]MDA0159459.1 FAD-dependent monooxygenase [Solirubrobacter ginsenosidimutans]
MRVAIAGGGLGGLAAALFLLRAGVRDVQVFEQQPQLGEIGAGIQVGPNAVRLLQRLSLGAALTDVAVPFEVAWEFRRWQDGRVLFSESFGAAGAERFGAPYLALHRVDLLSVLASAVPAGVVALGRHVEGVDGDRFVFADGSSSDPYDALIGADGIHSVVRSAIAGPGEPVFTGLAAYRALVPVEQAPEFARRPVCSIWLGPSKHFVHYPVSGGSQVNLVTANPAGDWREESWIAEGSVPDFLAEFSGWDAAVLQLIGAARETRRYAFYAREPIPRWVSGRVALLGDAAHPMLPFFAQGAGQAIEDGAVLAGCLRGVSASEVVGALKRYEALRIERATRVQRMSGERREHHHMPDGPEQVARDAALGSQDPLSHNEWLYGHDVEADL